MRALRGVLTAVMGLACFGTALIGGGTPGQRFISAGFTFEENRGQADAAFLYLARNGNKRLGFTQDGFHVAFGGSQDGVRLTFVASDPDARPLGVEQTSARSHYFKGRRTEDWLTGIRHYRRVVYRELYPGIDACFYPQGGDLEYDLVLQPGVDPSRIELEVDGADSLEIDRLGNLVIRLGEVSLVQTPPIILQKGSKESPGQFEIRGEGRFGFRVGEYDPEKNLTVDPVLSFSTFLGGSNSDSIRSIALDSAGNIFVVGETYSTDFPTVSPVQAEKGERPGYFNADAFVAKYSPGGNDLLFATYLGGERQEYGWELEVGPDGTPYVAGTTESAEFPLVNPIQGAINLGPVIGSRDGFITRLSADGSQILYSTYLGGSKDDNIEGIGIDATGNIYVAGYTRSADFPVVQALKTSLDGDYDAFVTKLNPAGSAIRFSTYYGGSGMDLFTALTLDSSGSVYLGGLTESTDFPVFGAVQAQSGGGRDGTVVKLNSQGSQVLFSTHLGGAAQDEIRAIDLGPDGSIFLTGFTASDDFPVTPGAAVSERQGRENAYLSRFSSTGDRLIYSSYLGGNGQTWGFTVKVDGDGQAHLGGNTGANNFPVVAPIKASKTGGTDSFIASFSAGNPPVLTFASYLGGDVGETGYASDTISDLDVDAEGNLYLGGWTNSTDFPTKDALQTGLAGREDGFLTILEPTRATLSVGTSMGRAGRALTVPITLEGGEGVTAFRFTLSFDPDEFSVPAGRVVAAGGLLAGHTLGHSVEGNRVTVTGFSSGLQSLTGPQGTLVTVTLQLDESLVVGQAVNLKLDEADLADAAGNSLVPALVDGTVTVSNALPVPVGAENQIVFPQVANGQFGGGSFVTTLVFVNRSQKDALSEIVFSRSDGSPLVLTLTDGRTDTRFDLEIPASGALFLQTDGRGDLAVGFARVSSTEPLGGTLIFTALKPDRTSSSETAVGVSPVGEAFTLPVLVGSGENTGIALANVSSEDTEVTLTLLDSAGTSLETSVRSLPAGHHLALFATELFGSLSAQARFEGRIEVVSEKVIAVVALKQEGILLTTFPVLEPLLDEVSDP